ncbi:MAG: 2-oxo-4-hydroxy-4-carboxy-5-ureidoimidazoline decarboxylase [Alkalinema sp. RU_4_3]|nr:2-oxo-4-hydroxy-4-carboxy-5-ureidoimidazoline decarboxylase [Alkalinema sp. RU_4_3]
MQLTIAEINQLSQPEFVTRLGFVFEQTPEIMAAAWEQRPFCDRPHLHQVCATIVRTMTDAEQIKLISAHPDLGSRLVMAEASVKEQAGAGLDRLTPTEYAAFQQANQQYQQQFGFPFIIAVRQQTKVGILAAFQGRLKNDRATEQRTAIAQILEIARFRLEDTIS